GRPTTLRRGKGQVDGRAKELEYKAAAVPDSLAVGLDLHPRLELARARRDQHPGTLDLDHAHAAHIHGRERLEVAQRWRVDAESPAGVEDGRPLRRLHLLAVDGRGEHPLGQADE